MGSIHLSQARRILALGQPVNLKVWSKDGRIIELNHCVSLRWSQYGGTRQVKLLESRQIRTIRDVCIFDLNDNEVYL